MSTSPVLLGCAVLAATPLLLLAAWKGALALETEWRRRYRP